jgi:hypothetical protein
MLTNVAIFCGILCIVLSQLSGNQMSRMVYAKKGVSIPFYKRVLLVHNYEEVYGKDANSVVFRLSTLGIFFFMLLAMITASLHN